MYAAFGVWSVFTLGGVVWVSGADRDAEKLALTDQLLVAALGELGVVAREQPCLGGLLGLLLGMSGWLASTSRAVRSDIRSWVVTDEGDRWSVKLDVRDLGGHLDSTFRGWSATLATRVRLVIAGLVLIFAHPLDFHGTSGYPFHVYSWRFAWYRGFFSC